MENLWLGVKKTPAKYFFDRSTFRLEEIHITFELHTSKSQKYIFLEVCHVGYQSFSDTPTKRLVKKSSRCDLSRLRKVQKCVFLGLVSEKGYFHHIIGLFSA